MVINRILKLFKLFKQECHKALSCDNFFFKLCINDLHTSSNNFKMIMYADATTLYCNIENRDDCEDTINN